MDAHFTSVAVPAATEPGRPVLVSTHGEAVSPAPFAEAPGPRAFPGAPVIAGAVVGLCVTTAAAWWGYRRWSRHQAEAAAALAKAQVGPRPTANAAA